METQGSESDLYGIMKSTGSHNKLSAGAQLRGSISHDTFKVQILNSDTKDGLKFVPHCFSSGTNEMGEGFKLTKHYLHSSITWLERGTEGRRHLRKQIGLVLLSCFLERGESQCSDNYLNESQWLLTLISKCSLVRATITLRWIMYSHMGFLTLKKFTNNNTRLSFYFYFPSPKPFHRRTIIIFIKSSHFKCNCYFNI